MRTLALLIVVLIGAAGYGFCRSQDKKPDEGTNQAAEWAIHDLEAKLFALNPNENLEKRAAFEKMIGICNKASTDKKIMSGVMTQALTDYYMTRNKAESAPQVTQAVGEASIRLQYFQIAQNQRMIELLEQIAAKK